MIDAAFVNEYFPVVGIDDYGAVWRVRRISLLSGRGGRLRSSTIKELSTGSLHRLAFLVLTTPTEFQSFLTLSYLNPPINGRSVKRELRAFLKRLTRNYAGVSYVWWMEWTKMGTVHLHLMTTIVPGKQDLSWLARAWVDLQNVQDWPYCSLLDKKERLARQAQLAVSGHARSWQLIRKKDGAKRYITKEACKRWQKVPPWWFGSPGRFWGASRDVAPAPAKVEWPIDDSTLREVLRSRSMRQADWDVIPGIIYVK
jgi:hypothetical protein